MLDEHSAIISSSLGSIDENNAKMTLSFGGYTYDENRMCLVSATGEEKRVRAQSLSVFAELAKSPDQIVFKIQLTKKIWPTVHVTDDSIGKCISDIRKALSDTEHLILKTFSRQGYMLISDKPPGSALVNIQPKRRINAFGLWMALGATLVFFGFLAFSTLNEKPKTPFSTIEGTPRVKLLVSNEHNPGIDLFFGDLLPELRVALSRYKTLVLSDSEDTEYRIMLTKSAENRLFVELQDNTLTVVYGQTYDNTKQLNSIMETAQRIAASIASPGVGALDR